MPHPIRQSETDACPGALRMHQAADGPLARIRLPGGRLTGTQLAALATMAADFGDGQLALTSRANVELRALTRTNPTELASHLSAAGLLPTPSHETVRNIAAPPLTDPQTLSLVAELDSALRADPALAELPGRFLFAIGPVPLSPDVSAIPSTETTPTPEFAILFAGQDEGLRVPPHQVVPALLTAAHAFLKARTTDLVESTPPTDPNSPLGDPAAHPGTNSPSSTARPSPNTDLGELTPHAGTNSPKSSTSPSPDADLVDLPHHASANSPRSREEAPPEANLGELAPHASANSPKSREEAPPEANLGELAPHASANSPRSSATPDGGAGRLGGVPGEPASTPDLGELERYMSANSPRSGARRCPDVDLVDLPRHPNANPPRSSGTAPSEGDRPTPAGADLGESARRVDAEAARDGGRTSTVGDVGELARNRGAHPSTAGVAGGGDVRRVGGTTGEVGNGAGRRGKVAWRVAELPGGGRVVAEMTAEALGVRLRGGGRVVAGSSASPVGVVRQPDGRVAVGAIVPLGRLTGVQLGVLAGADQLVVTPSRGVVVVDLSPEAALEWRRRLTEAGLPAEHDSRWVGVTACTGRPGCAKSLADVRADALATTEFVDGLPVHWLGCERGCGSPAGPHVRVEATTGGYVITGADGTAHRDPRSATAAGLAEIVASARRS